MSWKYVNPGYGELFDKNLCRTVKSIDTNRTITGVYITENGEYEGERIVTQETKDIWVRCDVYLNGIRRPFRIYVDGHRQCGLTMQEGGGDSDGYISLFNKGSEVANKNKQLSLRNRRLKVVLHITTDIQNGHIELFIDDVPVLTYTGNVADGKFITGVEISGVTDVFFSNIIVADYDISQESVAVCSLNDLTGTWEGISDGLTKATDVDQTLSQKIDTNKLKQLISSYSSDPTITSVSIAAIGIQYDPNKVNSLKSSIVSASVEVFSDTNYIKENHSSPTTTYIKNISTDTLKNMTLNLISVKQ